MNSYPLTAILLAFVAGLAAPLHGAAISGTLDGDLTLTPTATPGVYSQNFTGNGDDTVYGSFTSTSTSTADFSSPPHILISGGTLTETFADGTLFGTSSGHGTASGSGTAAVTIDFVITGGTGFFAGALGDATVTGTLTSTSPTTESFSGSYAGTLQTVPDKSTSLALLLPSAAVLFLARGRKASLRVASN